MKKFLLSVFMFAACGWSFAAEGDEFTSGDFTYRIISDADHTVALTAYGGCWRRCCHTL